MEKRTDRKGGKEAITDRKIEETLNREFPLPAQVERAKREAFEEIRNRMKTAEEKECGRRVKAVEKCRKKRKQLTWILGTAAALALFLTICVANPAVVRSIPIIGNLFEELGNSQGYKGDYEEYAESLKEPKMTNETEKQEQSGKKKEEGLYAKTSDGVTVTLSEVYCNEAALYLSLLIESEEEFPPVQEQDGKPVIDILRSDISFSYRENFQLQGNYLDGKFLNNKTYAGILRLNLEDTKWNGEETDASIQIPENFTINLNIHEITGHLPENFEGKIPEKAACCERDWKFRGEWDFTVEVTKDNTKTVTKELSLTDENGAGVLSVTKTPFEISLNINDPESRYAAVVLDAEGNPLSPGGFVGTEGEYAIGEHDVSTIYVYVCDALEYMDELKGYYWADTHEEQKKTKTFKELLDERAIYHQEAVFE